MRKLSRLLAALALPVLAGAGRADDGAIRLVPTDANVSRVNQQLADDIALQMKKSGRLADYSVNITTEGGVVTLAGRVASAQQRAEALNIARMQAGVVAVEDKLTGGADSSLTPVNFVQPPANSRGLHAAAGLRPAGLQRAADPNRAGRQAGRRTVPSDRVSWRPRPVLGHSGDSAVRLAVVYAVQQLRLDGLSDAISVGRLAVHRSAAPVSDDSVRLAERQPAMAPRLLVVEVQRLLTSRAL
jgi:hypothetical protein